MPPPPTRRAKLPRLCTAAANLGGEHHGAAAAADHLGDDHPGAVASAADTHTDAVLESIDDLADTLTPGTLKHTCFVLLRRAEADGMSSASVFETATAEGLFTGAEFSLKGTMSHVSWAVYCPSNKKWYLRVSPGILTFRRMYSIQGLVGIALDTSSGNYCQDIPRTVQCQETTPSRRRAHAAGGCGSVQHKFDEAGETPPGAQT